MATLRKRNGKWQAIIRHKDIGTSARSFETKAAAKAWAAQQQRAIDEGHFGKTTASTVTLGQLLERYVKEVLPGKRGAHVEIWRLKRLIRDPVSSIKMDQLSSQTLAEFRDRRLSDGARTTHYDLTLIRHCLNIAMNEWGLLLQENPCNRVRMPQLPKPRERRLLNGEYEQLRQASLSTLNPYVWPAIEFALATAMRRGEILGLQWVNIDFAAKTALLPVTKNGLSREVPLSSKAMAILTAQRKLNNEVGPFPVSANGFRLAWGRLRQRSGIKGLNFHDLRHEAISRFFEKGLSVVEVGTISGHQDPKMLFRYTHLRAGDLAKKLD